MSLEYFAKLKSDVEEKNTPSVIQFTYRKWKGMNNLNKHLLSQFIFFRVYTEFLEKTVDSSGIWLLLLDCYCYFKNLMRYLTAASWCEEVSIFIEIWQSGRLFIRALTYLITSWPCFIVKVFQQLWLLYRIAKLLVNYIFEWILEKFR